MSDHCPKCGGLKEPPPSKKTKRTYCKVCAATYARNRNATNPDRVKEIDAKYRKHNQEKIAACNKAFYDANREREKGRAQKWRLENKEHCSVVTRAWREANKERSAEMQRVWLEANKEHCIQYRKESHAKNRDRENMLAREWKKNNPAKAVALTAKRNAVKLQAIPAWADLEKIEAIYEKARNLSAETGIRHHVDHIVPLQSKWVCGLHCEANLQILPAYENQSKSNRFWPDMALAA
jgi:hypothetical protein